MSEHLVRIKLQNGEAIDIHREPNKDIKICHLDNCVIIPEATGTQTLGLVSLLESIGERSEFPEEEQPNE